MSRVLLGAAAAAGVLAGVIYWEAGDFVQPAMGELMAQAPPQVAGQVVATLDPPESVQAWMVTALERPLFRESRRPDGAAAGGVKAEATVRLAGVLTGPFGNRAIFQPNDAAKPVSVAEGGRVANFVVRIIEPGRVVVDSDGGQRTFKPSFIDTLQSASSPGKRIGVRPGN